jgi:acyl-coenzyme A synthetase/AMP-(fatty) acid ligase
MSAALIRLHKRRPFELPQLRALTNTGENLPLAAIDDLRKIQRELRVYLMFGLTECKRVSILLPEEYEAGKAGTVGRPLAGTEVFVVDAAGKRLGPGESGEIVVRGRHVAAGYWGAPGESARRFRRAGSGADVELFTGDRGRVDADGYLVFEGRLDELFKHRGHRISPLEIENEAREIRGILEAGVLQRGSDGTLHLFVTLGGAGMTGEDVRGALRRNLEPAKVPAFVHIVEEMPKGINGKVDRKALRDRLAPTF